MPKSLFKHSLIILASHISKLGEDSAYLTMMVMVYYNGLRGYCKYDFNVAWTWASENRFFYYRKVHFNKLLSFV